MKLHTDVMTSEEIERHKDYFENYELNPCPFCGCEMKCSRMHDMERNGFPWRYFITGSHEWTCYLKYAKPIPWEDREEAIETWNRRMKI